jgi:hypothetical protein
VNEEESQLVAHAIAELNLLMPEPRGEYDQLCCDSIIEMVRLFSKHGHSGFSAPWTISVLTELLNFRPLKPLTGDDSEWHEVGPDEFQNIRFGSVFKRNGEAYWLDGKMFSDDDGETWFYDRGSIVPVTFPWVKPETERILLPKSSREEQSGGALNDEEFIEYWASNSVEPGVLEVVEGDPK